MAAPAASASAAFRRVYDTLKDELLRDPAFDFNDDAIRWLDGMLDYNVLGGNLNRGLAVIESYKLLKAGSEPSEEEVFLAYILGWGIEWLQAYFLILDDIMENSHTRRGKPCWYRLPKVEFKTTSGELLDQIITNEGRKDLNKYTVHIYRRIVEYKTAYYSFYLPVACALLLSGQSLDDYVQVKKILVEMGVYFQIQDDYLDCFGDPDVIDKIGTDIENFKCSWLFVQALQRADDKQKDVLFENYGKPDPACVAKVKALYKELALERVFSEYERESYEKLISDIEAQPSETVQAVLKSFLHRIYKRK
ncbi:farnesyl pyrophosphate synthase-like isoform X3 [Phragmites australis]|uniref:farnesyl pyrophosphate synthase-like isoform X3 n=1 Tax=Phragmites australis TaxID=29695 RepID=UPI002D765253|nr:farnesyl pyrophosphate synthase-like isoform X3 [Phragmites australis]